MTADRRRAWNAGAIGPLLRAAFGESRNGPPAWTDLALCAETDPEEFYPEKGGPVDAAKKVCARCPVTSQCLSYALGNQERFGVWGGLSEQERRNLKREAA